MNRWWIYNSPVSSGFGGILGRGGQRGRRRHHRALRFIHLTALCLHSLCIHFTTSKRGGSQHSSPLHATLKSTTKWNAGRRFHTTASTTFHSSTDTRVNRKCISRPSPCAGWTTLKHVGTVLSSFYSHAGRAAQLHVRNCTSHYYYSCKQQYASSAQNTSLVSAAAEMVTMCI